MPLFNAIYVDISELASSPHRTGVQRVLTSIISEITDRNIMLFRVIDRYTVGILDPMALDAVLDYFPARTQDNITTYRAEIGQKNSESAAERRLRCVTGASMVTMSAHEFFTHVGCVLNLEMYASAERSHFYISCPSEHCSKVHHLIHDFLLFESPEFFPSLNWDKADDYILLLEVWSKAGHIFVSNEREAQKAIQYLRVNPSLVSVVPFGGLDIKPLSPQEERPPHILVVGTIEPRKYPVEVAKALHLVRDRIGGDVRISWVGRWGWLSPEDRRIVESELKAAGVEIWQDANDRVLTDLIASATCGIYVSRGEGYGLPVIELLSAGVPVVSNTRVPAALESNVSRLLEDVTEGGLADAICDLIQSPPADVSYSYRWSDTANSIMQYLPVRSTGYHASILWSYLLKEYDIFDIKENGIPQEIIEDRNIQNYLDNFSRVYASVEPEKALAEQLSVLRPGQGLGGLPLAQIQKAVQVIRPIISEIHIRSATRAMQTIFIQVLGRKIDRDAFVESISVWSMNNVLAWMENTSHSREANQRHGDLFQKALIFVCAEFCSLCKGLLFPGEQMRQLWSAPEVTMMNSDVISQTDMLAKNAWPMDCAAFFLTNIPRMSPIQYLLCNEICRIALMGPIYFGQREIDTAVLLDPNLEGFVRESYQRNLRKDADLEGLSYYLNELSKGKLTREALRNVMIINQ